MKNQIFAIVNGELRSIATTFLQEQKLSINDKNNKKSVASEQEEGECNSNLDSPNLRNPSGDPDGSEFEKTILNPETQEPLKEPDPDDKPEANKEEETPL